MATKLPPVPPYFTQLPYPVQDWLRQVRQFINGGTGGGILYNSLDFTSSNLTSILTRNHDDLQNISGGTSGQFFHLTSAEHTTVQTLTSGTYTPTLTNVANLDASTAFSCQYMRVGNTVTVSGKVSVDPTAAANTQLGISLPISSNLSSDEQCAGTANSSTVQQAAAIRGDSTNHRAEMIFVATSTANQPMYFSFTYRII